MKKVITFGVFDYFHLGHLNLLEEARRFGDFLTVAVQVDEKILAYKPNAHVLYTTQERIRFLRALRIVDEVVTYCDVDQDIQAMDFDVFAIGEDQLHEGFQRAVRWCEQNGKQVVRMHYTQGISSTMIKNQLEEKV